MPIFSAGTGITGQYIINNAQSKLAGLRNSLLGRGWCRGVEY